jgi:inositol phosphorylceramide mannosyltransferase catalytic subunit
VVPRILHQIWLGGQPLPDEFAGYRETWLLHHPDWEHRFWTEENLPSDLRRPEVYERLRMPAERSDILRLEVLFREGGVYVDTDFECHRPLDPVIGDLDFVTAPLKPNGWVNNAFIGSTPRHPIIERALREIQPREFYGLDKHGTGPRFFDRIVKQYPEVTLLAPELLYQTSPGQLEDAVATHHAAGSWKTIESYRNAVKLAERRNYELRGRIEELERELAKAQGKRRFLRR